jgi:hypothetical protein
VLIYRKKAIKRNAALFVLACIHSHGFLKGGSNISFSGLRDVQRPCHSPVIRMGKNVGVATEVFPNLKELEASWRGSYRDSESRNAVFPAASSN